MLYLLLWRLLQLCGLASSPGRQLAFLRSSAQPGLIVLGWPVKYFVALSFERKKIIFITGRWWGREVLLPSIRLENIFRLRRTLYHDPLCFFYFLTPLYYLPPSPH
jgi:hypothetical protein